MKIVSMDELETLYGRHKGAPLELQDLGINRGVVNDVLLNEVADIVEQILEKHIMQDIYAAYQPKTTYYGKRPPIGWRSVGDGYYQYARRWSLVGNYVRKMLGDTLFVTSDATPSPSVIGSGWSNNTGGFLQMVSTHPGKIWKGGFPRPALQNTQDEIENNGYAQKALEAALLRGLKRYTR